jgi:integrase
MGYREIFIDEETARVLRQHIAARAGSPKALVFSTSKGTSLTVDGVLTYTLYPICDKLSIKRGGMHGFRHGRVSLLQTSGAPADLIKRQIGHSSLRTTGGYTHFSEDFQRDLADRLSWTQAAKLDSVKKAANDGRLN